MSNKFLLATSRQNTIEIASYMDGIIRTFIFEHALRIILIRDVCTTRYFENCKKENANGQFEMHDSTYGNGMFQQKPCQIKEQNHILEQRQQQKFENGCHILCMSINGFSRKHSVQKCAHGDVGICRASYQIIATLRIWCECNGSND